MSAYQYYEFQAIDRALTEREMNRLRGYSARAKISPVRFVNEYSDGSFKGDAQEWMAKYFDASLHLASTGTRDFMLRLPSSALPPEKARRYCDGYAATSIVRGRFVVLSFRSTGAPCEVREAQGEKGQGALNEESEARGESEGGEESQGDAWVDRDEATLATLAPLRFDLASGDLRALYLGWLLRVERGEFDDDVVEPPCPPGLDQLSEPLEALAAFLRIDRDLLSVAAVASPAAAPIKPAALAKWIAALPAAEKTSIIVRLAGGEEPWLRGELLRRFRESCEGQGPKARRRTVGELRRLAESVAQDRRRREEAREQREQARLEKQIKLERRRYLLALGERQMETWAEVDALLAARREDSYDDAIALLVDLSEVPVRGRSAEFAAQLARRCEEHGSAAGFLERLRDARLIEG